MGLYYRMARESGKFSIQDMRRIAYLASLNAEMVKVWEYKRGMWKIFLAT